jgi:thioredoxin 1
MSENVQSFNDDSFQQDVLKAEVPVLVDFWAEWCMPCRFIAPAVESLAREYHDKIKVGKVNVDESPVVSGQFGVSSIPTLLLFKDGKVVDGVIGAVPKEQIGKMIEKHLSLN